jgi:hypothetical protein
MSPLTGPTSNRRCQSAASCRDKIAAHLLIVMTTAARWLSGQAKARGERESICLIWSLRTPPTNCPVERAIFQQGTRFASHAQDQNLSQPDAPWRPRCLRTAVPKETQHLLWSAPFAFVPTQESRPCPNPVWRAPMTIGLDKLCVRSPREGGPRSPKRPNLLAR